MFSGKPRTSTFIVMLLPICTLMHANTSTITPKNNWENPKKNVSFFLFRCLISSVYHCCWWIKLIIIKHFPGSRPVSDHHDGDLCTHFRASVLWSWCRSVYLKTVQRCPACNVNVCKTRSLTRTVSTQTILYFNSVFSTRRCETLTSSVSLIDVTLLWTTWPRWPWRPLAVVVYSHNTDSCLRHFDVL